MCRIGLTLLAALLGGCQASQSPAIPTSKDITVTVYAEGDVRVEIHYDQETVVELGGGNVSSPKQDNKLELPVLP